MIAKSVCFPYQHNCSHPEEVGTRLGIGIRTSHRAIQHIAERKDSSGHIFLLNQEKKINSSLSIPAVRNCHDGLAPPASN